MAQTIRRKTADPLETGDAVNLQYSDAHYAKVDGSVQYLDDGSITTKIGGSYKIPSKAGESNPVLTFRELPTKFKDLAVGTNISGATFTFNGNSKPIKMKDDWRFSIQYEGTTAGDTDPSAVTPNGVFTLLMNNDHIGFHVAPNWTMQEIMYQNGAWNKDSYTFKVDGLITRISVRKYKLLPNGDVDDSSAVNISVEEADSLFTDDSWKLSDIVITSSNSTRNTLTVGTLPTASNITIDGFNININGFSNVFLNSMASRPFFNKKGIALLSDLVWNDVTSNFTVSNDTLPFRALNYKKEIVLSGENNTGVDLVITANLTYGAASANSDYTLQGSEGDAIGFYDASITAESGTTKTVITIPKEVKRFDIKYFKI